jgi:hypothetical protein
MYRGARAMSVWSVSAIKKSLHLNEPVLGYGRLLAEMA